MVVIINTAVCIACRKSLSIQSQFRQYIDKEYAGVF